MNIRKIIAAVCAAALAAPAFAAPVLAASAVSDEAGLNAAITAGGDYELAADITAANAGINTAPSTGTLDGKGHTVTKKDEKWGDAVLYQNCGGNWTFKDLTIDGNKSTGTFWDAALWYMAGTVSFENVTIRNFTTNSASRYALNCNSTADVTLKNVTFTDNENDNAVIEAPDVYTDGGTLHLAGDTKAGVYYAGGSVDISGLSGGCDITITASDSEKYKTLTALNPPASVSLTADAAAGSIHLSDSGVKWTLSAERSESENGQVTVFVSVSNFTAADTEVEISAAAYGADGAEISEKIEVITVKSGSAERAELAIEATDGDRIVVALSDNATKERLAENVTVTKVRDNGLLYYYDFENPEETASMIYGGAAVESGGGISGNGLRFGGENGYMQLPNGIISENMTVSAWVRTDAVQDWARMFDFGSDSASNYFFYSPANGRVESRVNGKTDTMNVQSFANAGIWEHYAVTRSADHVQLYRNGELVSEAGCGSSLAGMKETTNYMGKSHYEADRYFKGTMDEIKIYNRICTGDEIKSEYDRYAAMLGAEAAHKDYAALGFGTTELTDGTELPVKGAAGSDITWTCDAEGVIGGDMKINAPAAGEPDKSVTLTAVVKNGSSVYNKTFAVTVLAAPSVTGLSDYPMSDIEMDDAYLINGGDKMAEWLKEFDIDKLASGFRRTAGMPTTASYYGGWENCLIAGHTIGHYLSAIAQRYGDTGDEELLRKSDELIDELYEAQIKEDTVVNGRTLKKGFLFATCNNVVSGEMQFDNIENNKGNIITEAWVPWYTMHKILAGLLDVYKLTGNEKALEIADGIGTWTYNRVSKYSASTRATVLNVEYGGMNDALYELYKITKNPIHAKAAHVFDEISLFDSLYRGEDVLANKHANTTIPKIIGALNRVRTIDATGGQLEKDAPDDSHDREYYLTVAENFWDMVVNDHSYITGGNSENEHFRAAHTENAYRNNVNCETCNTYNMLKLSRELYKITGEKKYKDYYEGTFLNAIVSSQNPETGMTMYFQPMATGYFKVYSTRWNDFWCCTGSGMENFTKLTDSIYYRKDNKIVINQYISSVLTDKNNGIRLTQKSELPDGDTSEFTVELTDAGSEWSLAAERSGNAVKGTVTNNGASDGGAYVYAASYNGGALKSVKKIDMTVGAGKTEAFEAEADGTEARVFLWDGSMRPLAPAVDPDAGSAELRKAALVFRVPEWCASSPTLKINGDVTEYTRTAGYITVDREWRSGDTVSITMPMEIRAYGLPDSETVTAFKYGPTVLSVGLGVGDTATESHGMSVRKPKNKSDVNEYVIIDSDYGTREEWLENLDDNMVKTDGKLEFTMKNTDQALVFTPHYRRHNERYGIYWYVSGMTEAEQQEQILADKRRGRDENTVIDSIEPSHDQQENGHGYTQDKSTGIEGTGDMINYREIANGGYVDYQMAVRKGVKNYLTVTYYSGDAGRQMSVYAGDYKLADVTAGGNDETVRYEIPDEVVNAAEPSAASTIKGMDALHIIFRADKGTDAPKLCGEVRIVTDYGTDPALKSLSFDTGRLSPDFASGTEQYTLSVPAGTEEVSLKAELNERYGLVYVNDTLINDTVAKKISLSGKPIVIKSYAEDHETSKTYTVSVVYEN